MVRPIINIEKINEVFLRFYCDDFGVESEIVEFFKFEVPGAKFMPAYKARVWDGYVRLANPIKKTLYIGLLPYLQEFANQNKYEIKFNNDVVDTEQVDEEELKQYIKTLNLTVHGKPIELHDYQFSAIYHSLTNKRAILSIPTGGGKSAIIYTISRYLLERGENVLIVVPTTSLCVQMQNDFVDYSSINGWNVAKKCQVIYSGFPKQISHPVVISTWQSIYKLPKQWFNQFGIIFGDEAHLFATKSLTKIMESLDNTSYRIGTTGSLKDSKTHKLVLEGIFGPVYKPVTTKQLQDRGTLSDLQINTFLLDHNTDTRKYIKDKTYQEEIAFLVAHEKRNNFICNLAIQCKGNTLVMFNYVEKHGTVLFEILKEKLKSSNRQVYFIHGGVDVDDREQIRHLLSSVSDAIVVSSYGTMSTGINIPSIENLIFASPSKSIVRVLQTIGRGLRLNKDKNRCTLYDLIDDMHWKNHKNFTLNHGTERIKIYSGEQFNVKLYNIKL